MPEALFVLAWFAEASREAFADFDEVASSDASLDFEADADKDPCEALLSVADADRDLSDVLLDEAAAESDDCDALLSVAEADRDLSDVLLELAAADSEADLLEVLSNEESWLEVAVADRLSVFSWLRVRLWSWVFEASSDVSRLLLLDLLVVMSEAVERVAEMLAPRE